MDLSKKGDGGVINDRLNIYRIINGANRLPYTTKQLIIPTYFNIGLGGFMDGCYSFVFINDGEITVEIENAFSTPLNASHLRYGAIMNTDNSKIILPPGSYFIITKANGNDIEATLNYTKINYIPANFAFNDEHNRYTKAKYHIVVSLNDSTLDGPWNSSSSESYENYQSITNHHWAAHGGYADIILNIDANEIPEDWFLNTESTGGAECATLGCGSASNGNRYGITQWGSGSVQPSWYRIWVGKTKMCDVSTFGGNPC